MGVAVRQKIKGRGKPWWMFLNHNGKRTSRIEIDGSQRFDSVQRIGLDGNVYVLLYPENE